MYTKCKIYNKREYQNLQAKKEVQKPLQKWKFQAMTLNPWLKIWQMNYINWKVNMQKVHNLMQILTLELKDLNLKASKLISMNLKNNMQNQTISWIYWDDKETKYSSNPNDILKSAENFYEKLYTMRQPQKLLLLNCLAKFLTKRKSQMNNFTFVRLRFL